MNVRHDWEQLQAHLSAARDLFLQGHHAEALEAVDAALACDPQFLAAAVWRERIVTAASASSSGASSLSGDPLPIPHSSPTGEHRPSTPDPDRVVPPAIGVSVEGYAKFEQRARRRRLDRRIVALRDATARGDLTSAVAALDEIFELDPELPELGNLAASVDRLRAATRRSHGPWVAAAAIFAGVLFAAPHVDDVKLVAARSIISVVSLVSPTRPLSADVTQAPVVPAATSVGTAGSRGETLGDRPAPPIDRPAPPVDRPVPGRAMAAFDGDLPGVAAGVSPPIQLARAVPESSAPIVPSDAAASAASPPARPATSPLPTARVDDEALVRTVLQRYRSAYDSLDARSAGAVYPGLNQAALTRAFEGLVSQTLIFDACDVQLRGEAAAVTCRGSARYVPKVGSRETRTEPRVWTFMLRKSGTDWRIENARANR